MPAKWPWLDSVVDLPPEFSFIQVLHFESKARVQFQADISVKILGFAGHGAGPSGHSGEARHVRVAA